MPFAPSAIVVHCSASLWGDAAAIRGWHLARGFNDIGYHGVVLNGFEDYGSRYSVAADGLYEAGRDERTMGAHCKAGGMNRVALGVCVIGNPGFKPESEGWKPAPDWCFAGWTGLQRRRIAYCTQAQFAKLVRTCSEWCERYGISPSAITQHSDHDRAKPPCASLNMGYLRKRVREELGR